MGKCEYCGSQFSFGVNKCPSCGASIETNYKKIINDTLNKDKNKFDLHFIVCIIILISSLFVFFLISERIEFNRSWNSTLSDSFFYGASMPRRPVESLYVLSIIYLLYRMAFIVIAIFLKKKKKHFNLAYAILCTFTVSMVAGIVCFIDHSRDDSFSDKFLKNIK